ncbi:MAG: sialidase family protein, partial [Collinsella intestinalis]
TYMMVDLWPGGVALNTAKHQDPVNGSGYVQIDGRQRLVLFASPVPSEQRKVGAEQGEGYTHYVGDFAADGLAPVYRKDGGAVERYVDRHYYLYDQNKDPLYCQQLGSSAFVQQNVFFYKAELHVATSYLWLISSNDAGATWTDPLMLNEQVRTNLPGGNAAFYGVGPGRAW